jgi:hypothetical protein
MYSEEEKDKGDLTKEAFERLLKRAAQPIRNQQSPPEVEKTSEPRHSGG